MYHFAPENELNPMYSKRCRYCKHFCIRKGKSSGLQRYQCMNCKRYGQSIHRIKLKTEIDKEFLLKLHKEGLGISGISRILEIAKSTVQRKLKEFEAETTAPEVKETGQDYEVDELKTYIGKKNNECWVMYAINRKTKQVFGLTVGRRTKENLRKVIDPLLLLNPRKIYTDGLNSYPGLIPKKIHRKSVRILAFIERKNLTLRTHLKRLNRKTICYSKSEEMLRASVKLYLYG